MFYSMSHTLSMDVFPSGDFREDFVRYESLISDRGSVYSVTAGRVTNRSEIKKFLEKIHKDPRYHAASHNAYAVRIEKNAVIHETKNDDGEIGAGDVILKELRRFNSKNICVCVTRWYGGEKLMNDRFAHIQNATRAIFAKKL